MIIFHFENGNYNYLSCDVRFKGFNDYEVEYGDAIYFTLFPPDRLGIRAIWGRDNPNNPSLVFPLVKDNIRMQTVCSFVDCRSKSFGNGRRYQGFASQFICPQETDGNHYPSGNFYYSNFIGDSDNAHCVGDSNFSGKLYPKSLIASKSLYLGTYCWDRDLHNVLSSKSLFDGKVTPCPTFVNTHSDFPISFGVNYIESADDNFNGLFVINIRVVKYDSCDQNFDVYTDGVPCSTHLYSQWNNYHINRESFIVGSVLFDSTKKKLFLLNRYSLVNGNLYFCKEVDANYRDFFSYYMDGVYDVPSIKLFPAENHNFYFYLECSNFYGEYFEMADCTCFADLVQSLDAMTLALGALGSIIQTSSGGIASSIDNKALNVTLSSVPSLDVDINQVPEIGVNFANGSSLGINFIPCIEFCNGASLQTSLSAPISFSPNTSIDVNVDTTVNPITIVPPTGGFQIQGFDWGDLITLIGTLISLLRDDFTIHIAEMPCIEFCDDLGIDVTFPNSINIGSMPSLSVSSLPNILARITDMPRSFSISNFPTGININNWIDEIDIGNFPSGFNINDIPCIEFCDNQSVGISSMPSLSVSSLPNILARITDMPKTFSISNFPTGININNWIDEIDIGNFPSGFNINDMPCVSFCNNQSIGISSMPSLLTRITDMPRNFSISSLPVIHNVIESLPNLIVESFRNALSIANFPNSFNIGSLPNVNIASIPCISLCEGSEITVNGLDGFEITVGSIEGINVELEPLITALNTNYNDMKQRLEAIEDSIIASETQIDLLQFPLEASMFKVNSPLKYQND